VLSQLAPAGCRTLPCSHKPRSQQRHQLHSCCPRQHIREEPQARQLHSSSGTAGTHASSLISDTLPWLYQCAPPSHHGLPARTVGQSRENDCMATAPHVDTRSATGSHCTHNASQAPSTRDSACATAAVSHGACSIQTKMHHAVGIRLLPLLLSHGTDQMTRTQHTHTPCIITATRRL
jgi:hypothetical protein